MIVCPFDIAKVYTNSCWRMAFGVACSKKF